MIRVHWWVNNLIKLHVWKICSKYVLCRRWNVNQKLEVAPQRGVQFKCTLNLFVEFSQLGFFCVRGDIHLSKNTKISFCTIFVRSLSKLGISILDYLATTKGTFSDTCTFIIVLQKSGRFHYRLPMWLFTVLTRLNII
jgi:hypothetical protein